MPETPDPPRLFGFPIVEHAPCTDPTCVLCTAIPAGTLRVGDTIGPITISGVWDDGGETCVSCQQLFTPGPEGTAVAIETSSGRRFGPLCPACGAALVAPDA